MEYCANCGAELKEGAKFCTQCGQAAVAASPEREPTPSSLPQKRRRIPLWVLLAVAGAMIACCVWSFAYQQLPSFKSAEATLAEKILNSAQEAARLTREVESAEATMAAPTPTGPDPTTTPASALEIPLVSGGLGVSEFTWQRSHGQPQATALGSEYEDGKYIVRTTYGLIVYIERNWAAGEGVALDTARAESEELLPPDREPVMTYEPEGMPELVVDLYHSESLRIQVDSGREDTQSVWLGGEPGDFIIIYGVFDDRVQRMIVATGNNP